VRILITGAAVRIGAAIAKTLAADRHEIIIHYHRSETAAAALAHEIGQSGGSAHCVAANLADRAAVEALLPNVCAQFGRPDVLINNASSFVYDNFPDFDDKAWDFHIHPNLEAPVFLARDFVRLAREQGASTGAIINMLDHKIHALNPDFFTYSVAKLGQAAATRMMAQACAGGPIRVNGIAPGITLISGRQSEAGFARAFAAPPLGRSSTPAEIAQTVRYILATPSLNGEILVLDGGESLVQRGRDVAYALSPL